MILSTFRIEIDALRDVLPLLMTVEPIRRELITLHLQRLGRVAIQFCRFRHFLLAIGVELVEGGSCGFFPLVGLYF